jgi:hypothetical protein
MNLRHDKGGGVDIRVRVVVTVRVGGTGSVVAGAVVVALFPKD